ncbi:MAG TPA: hypothetical protein VMG40_04000 [Bryobacteraceae bacterium]|nr:hypothetical protein [Bryobacteraceae bacterium]
MRPLLLALTLVFAGIALAGSDPAPQMDTLSAKTAKPGDVLEISGVGLSGRNVDELYLTDNKFDMRVKVLEQKDTLIRFRVPPFAKPGRVQVLVLTKGDNPKLLEQPLYVVIEDATPEVTQVKAPADPAPAPAPAPKAESHESKDSAKQDKN